MSVHPSVTNYDIQTRFGIWVFAFNNQVCVTEAVTFQPFVHSSYTLKQICFVCSGGVGQTGGVAGYVYLLLSLV